MRGKYTTRNDFVNIKTAFGAGVKREPLRARTSPLIFLRSRPLLSNALGPRPRPALHLVEPYVMQFTRGETRARLRGPPARAQAAGSGPVH